MDKEKCVHVANGAVSPYATVTHKTSGQRLSLCQPCLIEFVRKEGDDPREPIGYHVYRSSDPDLPKAEWKRLTDAPIPDNHFKDKLEEPGVVYYYYVTAINAYGQ